MNLVVAAMLILAVNAFGVDAAELTFDFKIEHGRVPDNMRLVRVKEGDFVKLRFATDQAVVLHLHGYDVEKRAQPGGITVLAFTAYATGRFPVYLHTQASQGGSHAEVPLIDVEVYPR